MARRKLPSGGLEQRVLDVLWSAGRSMTTGEVHESITTERELAYTTVMTILTRLWEKGELSRHKEGRSYTYEPVVGRDERIAQRMQDVLAAAGDPRLALNSFAASLSKTQRSALRQALEQERRER